MSRYTVYVPCRVEVAVECPIATSPAEAIEQALRHFQPRMIGALSANAEFVEILRSWCILKVTTASGGARYGHSLIVDPKRPELTLQSVPVLDLRDVRDERAWR